MKAVGGRGGARKAHSAATRGWRPASYSNCPHSTKKKYISLFFILLGTEKGGAPPANRNEVEKPTKRKN
jgi:hypothetical protein